MERKVSRATARDLLGLDLSFIIMARNSFLGYDWAVLKRYENKRSNEPYSHYLNAYTDLANELRELEGAEDHHLVFEFLDCLGAALRSPELSNDEFFYTHMHPIAWRIVDYCQRMGVFFSEYVYLWSLSQEARGRSTGYTECVYYIMCGILFGNRVGQLQAIHTVNQFRLLHYRVLFQSLTRLRFADDKDGALTLDFSSDYGPYSRDHASHASTTTDCQSALEWVSEYLKNMNPSII